MNLFYLIGVFYMDYDEKLFKAKANIRARRIWLVFALLLTANYGSDVSSGLYPVNNYIIFVILCWIPFFIGEILLRIKGKDTDIYKYNLVIGYGIFYTFLLCTTESPIAFTYILPVTSLLVLYKQRKFMVYCGIANTASIICILQSHVTWMHKCFRYEKLPASGIMYRFVLYMLCNVNQTSQRIGWCIDRQH